MHDIVHELQIEAAPDRVFEAVTTASGIAGWWATDARGGAEGSELSVSFDGGAVPMRFTIDTVEPPELAHLTCVEGPEEWPGTQLAFRIEASDGGTVVRFWHGGWVYENGSLPRCSFQWAMHLDSLRRYLEEGSGSPAS